MLYTEIIVSFCVPADSEYDAGRRLAEALPFNIEKETDGAIESWTILSRDAAMGAGQEWALQAAEADLTT